MNILIDVPNNVDILETKVDDLDAGKLKNVHAD